jgi:cysteine desulfurase/selenocysteine lyase
MAKDSIKFLKNQFPIFKGALAGWSYLDNAATTQKPQTVIQAISDFYQDGNANIHRGLYELSSVATQRYEEVRKEVKSFLGASHESEIAFTSGTTESINIIANSFRHLLKEGDEVLISAMEHHSNLIPWQQACLETKAILKVIPVSQKGELVLDDLPRLLSAKTKIVAVSYISNTLGTINPIVEIVGLAHQKKIPVLIDAAQAAGHYKIDVSQLDVDFLAFSAHKMFGPMGTGVLYVKKKYHELIRPLMFGGGAIRDVHFGVTKFREFPFCVEPGTPHVPGVIGLGTAIDFLFLLDWNLNAKNMHQLATLMRERLKSLPFVSVIGSPQNYSGIVSFFVEGIHAHDVASFLADQKIAVRAGHHCTQPLHEQLGVPASVRVSFALYNTADDVERIHSALVDLKKFWS